MTTHSIDLLKDDNEHDHYTMSYYFPTSLPYRSFFATLVLSLEPAILVALVLATLTLYSIEQVPSKSEA